MDSNKSGRWKYVTIPDAIKSEILNDDFIKPHSGWFVFGDKLRPHPTKQCSPNTFNYQHGKILDALVKSGEIQDKKGLSFYSWKDTGITELGDYVDLLSLQRQAGHTDPKVTLKYYHNKQVNKKFQKIDKNIFD